MIGREARTSTLKAIRANMPMLHALGFRFTGKGVMLSSKHYGKKSIVITITSTTLTMYRDDCWLDQMDEHLIERTYTSIEELKDLVIEVYADYLLSIKKIRRRWTRMSKSRRIKENNKILLHL